MRKILFLLLASLLFIAATQKPDATITILSDSKTFYLTDSEGNRLAQFPIDAAVTIKRKGK